MAGPDAGLVPVENDPQKTSALLIGCIIPPYLLTDPCQFDILQYAAVAGIGERPNNAALRVNQLSEPGECIVVPEGRKSKS
jgi:hypothetical protein